MDFYFIYVSNITKYVFYKVYPLYTFETNKLFRIQKGNCSCKRVNLLHLKQQLNEAYPIVSDVTLYLDR